VHAGDIAVQHHDVIGGDGEVREGVVAVEDYVDGHAGLAQPGCQRHGQLGVVFDHQHPHRRPPITFGRPDGFRP